MPGTSHRTCSGNYAINLGRAVAVAILLALGLCASLAQAVYKAHPLSPRHSPGCDTGRHTTASPRPRRLFRP